MDDGVIVSRSPADQDDVLGEFPWSLASARAAVAAARAAQPAWAALPLADRVAALERLRARFVAAQEGFAQAIAREVGKPLWEARSEAALLAAKITSTLGEGLRLVEARRPEGVDGEWRFRPHGVLAVLGPFNLPAHLPNGHVVPALLLGNTVVMKPSEKTPAVGALYAQAVAEAGLPPGVFGLVQGERRVGEWLSGEAPVDGVLFTGSLGVGAAIARANAARPGKILALELGGKNAAIVCADADLDLAAYAVAFGAFATAGQRCSSTSRCVVRREVLDAFAGKLAALAARVQVGHWQRPDVFMGPLISEPARASFVAALREGEAEGAEALVSGAALDDGGGKRGFYVRPSVHLVKRRLPASRYQRDELFGPDVALYPVDGDDEVLAVANDSRFGLCASVFTAERARFEALAGRLEAGVINWNSPTVGASGKLPFGGVKDSGNHRPAGITSSLYCAWPAALSFAPAKLDAKSAPPGLPLRG
ncbi:MAG TPA: aldehyde dehydrogenase family protein [Myxococcales bacterium]|nr:aldehyde dehydrogenase family protein [Myxococcales bacterium]